MAMNSPRLNEHLTLTRRVRVNLGKHEVMLKRNLLFPALIVGTIAVFFWEFILGTKSFTSDGQLAAYSEPVRLWSSVWATGWPVIGDPVSMSFYPVRIILDKLGAPFDIFVFSAFVISAIGMYFFLCSWLDELSASFGSLVFALSGWMLVHLGHTSMIHASAWLPWIMLGIDKMHQRLDRSACLGVLIAGVAVVMSVLSGHSQITLYTMLLVITYLLYKFFESRNWLSLSLSTFVCVLGVSMSAFVLVPTAEWVGVSQRSDISTKQIFEYSLPVSEIPGLIFSLVYGSTPYGWFAQDYIKPSHAGETLTFFPIVATVFALFSALGPCRGKLQVTFWLTVAGIFFLFALGDQFPPTAIILENVFPFNLFRAPARYMLIVTFCFSVLSAIGFFFILKNYIASTKIRLANMIISVVLVLGFAAITIQQIPRAPTSMGPIFPVLLTFSLAIATLQLIRIRGDVSRSRAFTSTAFAIFSVNIGVMAYQLPWNIYSARDHQEVQQPKWVQVFKENLGSQYRALAMEGWQSQVFNPDESRLHGVSVLGWYGPLLNEKLAEFAGLTNGGWVQRSVLSEGDASLDLLSVRYVSLRDIDTNLVESAPGRWLKRMAYDREVIYENLRVLPRARVVCDVEAISDEKDFRISVLLKGAEISSPARAFLNDIQEMPFIGSSTCNAEVASIADLGDEINVQVRLRENSGLLVLSDLWYPGWRAYVNGRETRVLRVNNVSRGILVRQGENTIKLIYAPSAFNMALAVAILAFAIFMAMLFLLRRGVLDSLPNAKSS